MKLAYIVSSFPVLSETFVTSEVLGLRALGLDIDVFAIKRPSAADLAMMTPEVQALQNEVHYLGRRDELRGLLGALSPRAHGLNLRLSREAASGANLAARIARARAVAAAARAGANLDLTIVGDGPKRAANTRLAGELGVADRLEITGWVPYSAMARYLGRNHIFALMADVNYHDGLPNVVVESLAVGRPVILSPLPAAREAVRQGENGFFLQSADAIDEAAALFARIAAEPDRIAAMAQAA